MFCRAGGFSSTVRSPRCCYSDWAAEPLSPVKKEVCRPSVGSLLFVWSVMIVGLFSGLGEDLEGYNLLITSTIQMTVVYRLCCVKSQFPLKPVHLPERAELIWCFLCVCSEMSRTVVCPGLHVSQTAISRTLFYVRWSSTWTLMDKRRCCWERMDRYGKSQDAEKVQHKGCFRPVTFKFLIKPTSLSRRNFFVTSSSRQVVKKMGSFSCNGGRASRVLCCPSSTWTWPGMVWESWLSSRWRVCTSYRCLLGLGPPSVAN